MKARLVLASGWLGVQEHLIERLGREISTDPLAPAQTVLLAPTVAAAHLLRSSLEESLLGDRSATVLPAFTTMSGLWTGFAARARPASNLAEPVLREALLQRAFEESRASGVEPPFSVRGGLARQVLAFHDRLLAGGQTLEGFEERAMAELHAPDDSGAERMAAQTRFLVTSLALYRKKLSELGLEDDATRAPAKGRAGFLPYRLVVAVGPETLTPAEFEWLRAQPGPEELTLVVPRGLRSHHALAALERTVSLEIEVVPSAARAPRLLHPFQGIAFRARDREETFLAVARLLKQRAAAGRLPPLERVAVVVPAPLRYHYLARKIFRQAGIPYQTQVDFPLAAEPYLAATDLALDFVERRAHRGVAVALLRSPFLFFDGLSSEAVAALDRLWQTQRGQGGIRRVRRWLARVSRPPAQALLPGFETAARGDPERPALAAVVAAWDMLAPLASPETSAAKKAEALTAFLDSDGLPPALDPFSHRHHRARAAVIKLLSDIGAASRALGDPPVDLPSFRATLRRAVEAHTFSARTPPHGVHLVDARAAGLGRFDLVILLGLNDGEWPAPAERSIFYPQWLLRQFGWPSDRELLGAARIAFVELVRLATSEVVLFRHELEDDTPVLASPFLEDAGALLESREVVPQEAFDSWAVTRADALRAALIDARARPPERGPAGEIAGGIPPPEPVSATAFELYLRCPFKYYARHVLGLDEEEDLDERETPRQRGRDIHHLLRLGFERWDGTRFGPRAVTPDDYEEALGVFKKAAEEILPEEGRGLEMARLFGEAGSEVPARAGALEWLLREEIARGPLRVRRVEHPFQGSFVLPAGSGDADVFELSVRGRADRVDIDVSGGLHVLDYKTGRAPEARLALQVPLYALCLERVFGAPAVEASYVSLEQRKAKTIRMHPFATAVQTRDLRDAVTAGRFPPRPYHDHLCHSCGYLVLCRKEIREGT